MSRSPCTQYNFTLKKKCFIKRLDYHWIAITTLKLTLESCGSYPVEIWIQRGGGQLLAEDKTCFSFYFFLITLIKYRTGIKCKLKRVKARDKIKKSQ